MTKETRTDGELIAEALEFMTEGSPKGPRGLEGLAVALGGSGLNSPVGPSLEAGAEHLGRIADALENFSESHARIADALEALATKLAK